MTFTVRARVALAIGAAPLALSSVCAQAQTRTQSPTQTQTPTTTLRIPSGSLQARPIVAAAATVIAIGGVSERDGKVIVTIANRGTAASAATTLRATDARGNVSTLAVPVIAAGGTVDVDAGPVSAGARTFALQPSGATTIVRGGATASYTAPTATTPSGSAMRAAVSTLPAMRAGATRAPATGTTVSPTTAPSRAVATPLRVPAQTATAPAASRGDTATDTAPGARTALPSGRDIPVRSALPGASRSPQAPVAPEPRATAPIGTGGLASGGKAITPIKGPTGPVSLSSIAQRITPIDRIVPPANVAPPPAKAQLLGSGEALATIQSHKVVKAFDITAKPINALVFDNGKYDLSEFTKSEGSLFPMHDKMVKNPKLFTINHFESGVFITEKGLELRSFLNYTINLGACTDGKARAAIAQAGADCATQMTQQLLAAQMQDKNSPRYVPDPALRQKKIAQTLAAGEGQIQKMKPAIAQLRTALATPEVQAAIGTDQATRLLAIKDDAKLAGEIISASETKLETTLTLPVAFAPGLKAGQKVTIGSVANGVLVKGIDLSVKDEGTPPDPVPEKVDLPATYALQEEVYLTGFTLGKKYEWRKRVEQTIPLCLVGCEETYFAEAYAGFEYGLGLRFPIRVGGTFDYTPGSPTATLTPVFTTIDGTPADYAAGGLEDGKIFDGQELVARVGAWAGVSTHLPLVPDINFAIGPRIDFTQYLPSPLTGGNFLPPTPTAPLVGEPYPITQIDLLNNMANFGIFGAHVHPVVQVTLESDAMSMTLTDLHDKARVKTLQTGVPVTVKLDDEREAEFKIGNASYTIHIQLTPGIDARLFIDVGLWSHNFDYILMFPQLALDIPKGGATFGPHDGTPKERLYTYGPNGGEAAPLPPDPMKEMIETAVKTQVKLPKGDCDDKCAAEFQGVKKSLAADYVKISKLATYQTFQPGWNDPLPNVDLSRLSPARIVGGDPKYRLDILYEYDRANAWELSGNPQNHKKPTNDEIFTWFFGLQSNYRTEVGPGAIAHSAARKKLAAQIDKQTEDWMAKMRKSCVDRYCSGHVETVAQKLRNEATSALRTVPLDKEAAVVPKLAADLASREALVLSETKRRHEFAAAAIETVDAAADKCPDTTCRAEMTTLLGKYEDYSYNGLSLSELDILTSWAELKPRLVAELDKTLAAAKNRGIRNAAAEAGWNTATDIKLAPPAGSIGNISIPK